MDENNQPNAPSEQNNTLPPIEPSGSDASAQGSLSEVPESGATTPNTEPAQPVEPSLNAEPIQPLHQADQPPTSSAGTTGLPDYVVPASATAAATQNQGSKKRLFLILAAAIVFLGLIGALSWYAVMSQRKETNTTQQTQLGAIFRVVDGEVKYGRDGGPWMDATTSVELGPGYSVRTLENSRAVFTLDDGSAIRIDENSQIRIESLDPNDIQIEQIKGKVYSRVVPSDRGYTVNVDGTAYRALGTAFVTIYTDDESGIQVYQSSVKASGLEGAIGEGSQFFTKSSDASLAGKKTEIKIELIADNEFINWNAAEDAKDERFKDRLGMLSQIKVFLEARKQERELKAALKEQARTEAAEKRAAEKAAKEKEAEERKRRLEEKRVTRGSMALSARGSLLTWSYSGDAKYGYKVVYSKKTDSPSFEEKHTESLYISDKNDTTAKFPSKWKIGKGRYYVRVCAYTSGTEDDTCVDYSNIVVINL